MTEGKSDLQEKNIRGNSIDNYQKKPDFLTSNEKFQKYQSKDAPKQNQQTRSRLLANIGVKPPKPSSENLIILGCQAVDGLGTMQVRSFLWLLDRLGVDYTYLNFPETEYCCSWNLVRQADGEEKTKAYEFSKYFIGLNIDQARKKGAKRIFYFCQWCNGSAQYSFPDNVIDIPLHYHLDLVVETLKKKSFQFRMAQPTKIAYYEGCHKRQVPNSRFDWPAYRQMLNHVHNLEVVDLPVKGCCCTSTVSEHLVSQAIQSGSAALITPCTACRLHIQDAARSQKFPVKLLPELLLEATGVTDEWFHQAKYGNIGEQESK